MQGFFCFSVFCNNTVCVFVCWRKQSKTRCSWWQILLKRKWLATKLNITPGIFVPEKIQSCASNVRHRFCKFGEILFSHHTAQFVHHWYQKIVKNRQMQISSMCNVVRFSRHFSSWKEQRLRSSSYSSNTEGHICANIVLRSYDITFVKFLPSSQKPQCKLEYKVNLVMFEDSSQIFASRIKSFCDSKIAQLFQSKFPFVSFKSTRVAANNVWVAHLWLRTCAWMFLLAGCGWILESSTLSRELLIFAICPIPGVHWSCCFSNTIYEQSLRGHQPDCRVDPFSVKDVFA